MAHLLFVDDDPDMLPKKVRHLFAAPAHQVEIANTGEQALRRLAVAAEVERCLLELDYGQYEGCRSDDIRHERPDWKLFRDGCPGGESPDHVGARADSVVSRVPAVRGGVLLFSSGHFLRLLAARWLGLEPAAGKYFLPSTASLSALDHEHSRSEPVIRLGDDTRHVGT
jgi:broad specificity phosphatase PhoE